MASPLEISFDPARLDFDRTAELVGGSYWGTTRTPESSRRAFDNSFCAIGLVDGQQVAFARVITDRAVFAYLLDVIVWPEHRGKGYGKRLVEALLDHPELAGVGHWCLTTMDAQGLYERYGFERSTDGRYMRLTRPSTPRVDIDAGLRPSTGR